MLREMAVQKTGERQVAKITCEVPTRLLSPLHIPVTARWRLAFLLTNLLWGIRSNPLWFFSTDLNNHSVFIFTINRVIYKWRQSEWRQIPEQTGRWGGNPGVEPSSYREPKQAQLGRATECRGEEGTETEDPDSLQESKEQTRGRERLGKENIQQSCLLFYFLRYDPEEGQTITFYSGACKRRRAAAETERANERAL